MFGKKNVQNVQIGKTDRSSNWYFIFAIAAAVIAGVLIVGSLKAIIPSKPILVATKTLQPGDRIDASSVNQEERPSGATPNDSLPVDAINAGYRVTATIAPGDPIRNAHIAELKQPGGNITAKTALLGPEYRAIALPAEATEGLLLEIGDKIDLVGVVDVPAMGQGGSATVSKIVVNAASVIYVPVFDTKDSGNKDARVIIGVTEDVFTPLALAITKGEVIAGLNADGIVTNSPSVTLNSVFGYGTTQ